MKNFMNLLGVLTLSLAVIATSGCKSTEPEKSNLITIPNVISLGALVASGISVFYIRRQVELASDPEILVYLDTDERHIECVFLCVENVGKGCAYDIKFTGDIACIPTHHTSLDKVGFIKHGISHLPSNSKREHFLISFIGNKPLLESAHPFEIKVTYKNVKQKKNAKNKPLDKTFTLNFEEWYNVGTVGKAPSDQVIEVLENISRNTKSLSAEVGNFSNAVRELTTTCIETYNGDIIRSDKYEFRLINFYPKKPGLGKYWAVAALSVVLDFQTRRVKQQITILITALKKHEDAKSDLEQLNNALDRELSFISFYDKTYLGNTPLRIVQHLGDKGQITSVGRFGFQNE